MTDVAQLIDALAEDPWRREVGFSPDIRSAQDKIFADGSTREEIATAVNEWIGHYQPCLFGKIAARTGLLRYCILSEQDLRESDSVIRDRIQTARSEWTRQGFEGRESGFLIVAACPKIAGALPNSAMQALAERLCSLYLTNQTILPNRIHLDEIFLEKPGPGRLTWTWPVGVNYFCAQGDGRWWHDHRIPGGMAFSMNSVGHMVKSGVISRAVQQMNDTLGVEEEGWFPPKVESLAEALDLAMRTIGKAADTPFGKATELLAVQEEDALNMPRCPIELKGTLRGKNHCSYSGRYHTDVTLPAEYFVPNVEWPSDLPQHLLDFTYLFDDNLDNPDYGVVGAGRRIRIAGEDSGGAIGALGGESSTPAADSFRREKRRKGLPDVKEVSDCPLLEKALRAR